MLVACGEPVNLCVCIAEIESYCDISKIVKVHLYAASVKADRSVHPLNECVVVVERTPSIICCLRLNERP